LKFFHFWASLSSSRFLLCVSFRQGGDFAAVGRGVAHLRQHLVQRAAQEISNGDVDAEVVAELLVDAVLSRAFRGGG